MDDVSGYPPNYLPTEHTLHVDIDLIDKCNLRCPTCWRGTGAQKNSSAILPLDEFRAIVRRIRGEGYPNLSLINWTEPFLFHGLHEYVAAAKEEGICSWLSSNLSVRPERYRETIVSALAAGVDVLFVSVSGFTQEVYQRNHVGGNIEWIKENLQVIAEARRVGTVKTSVFLRYITFPYNVDECGLWDEYLRPIGIALMPVDGWGNPDTPMPNNSIFSQHVKHRIGDFGLVDTATLIPTVAEQVVPDKVCTLVADRLAIDAKGDAYLCCAFPNSPQLKIGHYLDLSESELLLRRHHHPFCVGCDVSPLRPTTEQDAERFRRAISERAHQ
jgi:hypothetical protein